MKKTMILIALVTIVSLAKGALAEPLSLSKGDMLVYEHDVVDQGLAQGIKLSFIPADTAIKISKIHAYGYGLSVGSANWVRAERVKSRDNGLKYGFPLKVGMEWDQECDFKRSDHMYCKYVEKIEDVTVPAGTFKHCFKIVHKTLPDDEAEWYCPGVGIVKYEYHHHGTITNETYKLKKIVLNH